MYYTKKNTSFIDMYSGTSKTCMLQEATTKEIKRLEDDEIVMSLHSFLNSLIIALLSNWYVMKSSYSSGSSCPCSLSMLNANIFHLILRL